MLFDKVLPFFLSNFAVPIFRVNVMDKENSVVCMYLYIHTGNSVLSIVMVGG
jgi:hypothetical protein